ncbi:MAG: TrmH family RNA methyltransferase [Hominenteromicrobium sp.]
MKIEKITSRKSPVVRDAASLLQKAEKRSEAGLFMAEGARLCADAAGSGMKIAACFFTENAEKKYRAYLDAVLKAAECAYCIEEHIAPLLSDTKNPQGIFCVCRMPVRAADGLPAGAEPDSGRFRRVLVLENVQDPSNMGNILRTAEALGVRHLALVGACCDIYAPKVLRGSMGAVFRLGVRQFPDTASCLSALNGEKIASLAAVPDSTAMPITSVPFETGSWAVWIGNEGNGLTTQAVSGCHNRVTIPMRGRAESFNASTAAAIVLWEMMRGAGEGENSHG